jgi:formate dehydrogenase iron-sulfur subunit
LTSSKDLSRREFLKWSAMSTLGVTSLAALTNSESALASSVGTPNPNSVGMLVDTTRCIGCRACAVACKQWNHNPSSLDVDTDIKKTVTTTPLLNSNTFTNIRANEVTKDMQPLWVYSKIQCMHCNEPACVAACPVSAMQKTPDGPVTYDTQKCFGCRYCMTVCPFGIPTFQWDSAVPWVKKCTFCADRQKDGLQPACAGACPTGALKFGKREDLLVEARKRISGNSTAYVDHIYGETEVGGTSWMYLASVPFGQLGFPNLQTEPTTTNVKRAMNLVLPVLGSMTVLLSGIYWLSKRRETNGKKTAGNKK